MLKKNRTNTHQSVNTNGIMQKKRRSSKSWGYSRMNSVRLAENMGIRRNQLDNGGGMGGKSINRPTPTQAAMEFLN